MFMENFSVCDVLSLTSFRGLFHNNPVRQVVVIPTFWTRKLKLREDRHLTLSRI